MAPKLYPAQFFKRIHFPEVKLITHWICQNLQVQCVIFHRTEAIY